MERENNNIEKETQKILKKMWLYWHEVANEIRKKVEKKLKNK